MSPADATPPPRPALGRRLVFAVVTVLVVLGGIELALRATGWLQADRPESVLSFQQKGPFAPIPTDGGLVLPSGYPRAVLEPKRGHRVLLVGGSAALGAGYTPFAAMSGQLERWLRYADPAQPVEVIDMGIGGVASAQVLELLRESLPSAEADLVVIYSGNNEMLEAMVVQTMDPEAQRTQAARHALWSLHLFRLIQRLVPERPEPTGDRPGGSVHEQRVSLSDAKRAEAREQYRRNLRDMVGVARQADVPIVISTVATNQRDHSDPGGSPQERELYERGRQALAEGDLDAAREAFAAAEERAARPSRADRVLAEIVLEVARDQAVVGCDVRARLAEQAQHGIPGLDLFYDSCHPNHHGHERIAAAMARCALQAVERNPSALGEQAPTPTGGWSPWRLDHHTGKWDAQLPPDDGSPEAAAAAGHLAFAQQHPKLASSHYQQALERGGPEGPLTMNLALCELYQGRLAPAREQLERAATLLPDDLDVRQLLVTLGGGSAVESHTP